MKHRVFAFSSIFLVFLSFSLFYYFQFHLPQKRLTEAKKRLEEVQKDIERLKKFDEEKYAERLAKKFSCSLIFCGDACFSTSTDIKIEGVRIEYLKDYKIVINEDYGYTIELPKNVILNRSCESSDLNFDHLGAIEIMAPTRYWNVLSIKIWNKEEDEKQFAERIKDIEEEIKGKHYIGGIAQENRYFDITTKGEQIEINGENFYKVEFINKEICDKEKVGEFVNEFCDPNEPPFIGKIAYHLIKEDKIYSIYIQSEELEKYVKTFRFIKNEPDRF